MVWSRGSRFILLHVNIQLSLYYLFKRLFFPPIELSWQKETFLRHSWLKSLLGKDHHSLRYGSQECRDWLVYFIQYHLSPPPQSTSFYICQWFLIFFRVNNPIKLWNFSYTHNILLKILRSQTSPHPRSISMDPNLRSPVPLSFPQSSPTAKTLGNTPQCRWLAWFLFVCLCVALPTSLNCTFSPNS